MARKFNSYWYSGSPELEGSFSPSKTEQVGYRTVEQQINSFLQAGQMLNDYRRGVYDFNDVSQDLEDFPDVEEIDITRSPDFDEIDAQRTMEHLETVVKQKLTNAKKSAGKSSKEKEKADVSNVKPDDNQA